MAPGNPLDKARSARGYPEARVALLREKGSSLTLIANQLGVERTWVSHVNALRRRSPAAARVRKAIAGALGMSVDDAFPDLKDRVA
jgi:lambda repressor-like predicted transcriptional regulator